MKPKRVGVLSEDARYEIAEDVPCPVASVSDIERVVLLAAARRLRPGGKATCTIGEVADVLREWAREIPR